MTEQIAIYLVFAILFLIGIMQTFFPGKAVDIAIKWYGLWGMKLNRNHVMWKDSTMRVVGVFYLVCTSFFFYMILMARPA